MSTVTLTREKSVETVAEERSVTVKQLLTRARDLVAKGWTQGVLYEDGEGEEVELILPKKIEYVCSIGAMRLAFAELVEMEPNGTRVWYDYSEGVEYEAPVFDEEAGLAHPLYAEASRSSPRDPEVELNLILDHLLDPRPLDDLEERDERKEET